VRVWSHFTESRAVAIVAGFAAVLIGGTAYTVWAQSNLNEKVYTVSLLFVAVITYLAMVWEDNSDSWRGDRVFLLVCFLLGLGSTNHQMSVIPILALGVLLLVRSLRTLLHWRLLSAAAVLALFGFSVQLLFVPIRSGQNPIIDEADPQCASIISAITPDIQNGKLVVKCPALAASLARDQYQKPPLSVRQAPFGAQVANYFQYFDWQWARTLPPPARMLVTLLFIGLGLVGLWRHWKGDPDSFWYFATLLASVTIVLIYYLNFRYGYSMNVDIPPQGREVRERDYFFIVSFNLWGLYVGMGLVSAWESLGRRIAASRNVPLMAGLRGASPVLGIALLPLVLNYPLANRRGDYAARDWAYNMLQSVEPYGILFTNGDNDTFPLWYLQEVEGIRRDVTVIVHSYLGTKWYPKQLRDMTRPCEVGEDPLENPTVLLCQRPFDQDEALEIYAGMGDTPPTRSVHSYTDSEIDSLPLFQQAPAGQPVRFSDRLSVELATARYLYHPDFLVYRIISESLGDRPIYFASTAPPIYEAWDLQPQLLRHGLAYKLINGPIESTDNIVELDAQVGWVDRERTQALLWDVFQVDYLLEERIWTEPSTRASIPGQYYLAYVLLAAAHDLREATTLSDLSFDRSQQFRMLMVNDVP